MLVGDFIAKPFLKWAGGKSQLIDQIYKNFPKGFVKKDFTFVEPFVGGGAVLFWVLSKFPKVKKAIINDINSDLINTYIAIKEDLLTVIKILKEWEKEFHSLIDKKNYYYEKRDLFNSRKSDQTTQSALLIFLNRTCFNGLYRVNSKGFFNVPLGSYQKPQICNDKNLLAVSKALQKVEILNSDYSQTLRYAEKNTLFYLDPPYKPLDKTSSFTAYAKEKFDDKEQKRLKKFCDRLNKKKVHWLLSNSDLKGKSPNNNFFDELYSSFKIFRVQARRNINANPSKRGRLSELLIRN